MQKNDPSRIYDRVLGLVDESIRRIAELEATGRGHEELDHQADAALTLLRNFRGQIGENLQELRDLAEWDVFTVAMYGETNAGKSTIIETLRILLGEPLKLASSAEFRKLREAIPFEASHIEAAQMRCQNASTQLTQRQQELIGLRAQHASKEAELELQLLNIEQAIQHRMKTLTLWQRIVHWFRKFEEEDQLVESKRRLEEARHAHQTADQALAARVDEDAALSRRYQQEVDAMLKALDQLAPLADGAIIGNGTSDFTRSLQSYHFEAQGQKFTLIDVPGIEGNEQEVGDAINAAVRKAHAVFYVTRKPSPPNKGEGDRRGTLEKIRLHLGSQTEVRAIYNKGMTNPMALQAPKLVNEGEASSLPDLDREMAAQLGKCYQGHISLSALPAFYAATDCLLPTSSHYKNQRKFLQSMDAPALLEKSGFSAFARHLRDDLCRNYKARILRSNLRKIQSVVAEGASVLDGLALNFTTAEKNLSDQLLAATGEFDELTASMAGRIRSRCNDRLSEAKTHLRRKIYAEIDKEMSNDDFKQMLTHRVDRLKDDLVDELQNDLRESLNEFESAIRDVVASFRRKSDEILEFNINQRVNIGSDGFDLDFRISSGINTLALLTSVGSAAAAFLFTNPVGLTITAAIGAVALVFSIFKAVRSFFSSEYKKEQQRKSTDENLARVFERIQSALDQRISQAAREMKKSTDQLKTELAAPVQTVSHMVEAIRRIDRDMHHLAKQLKPQEAT